MKKGIVNFYDERKDYGKILSDCGEVYSFKLKNVVDDIELRPKTRIQFNPQKTKTEQMYAENIQILHWAKNKDLDDISIMENIASWSQAAGKDELQYFYEIEEIKELQSGKKNFVIGRKGTGKTAICEYLNIPSSGIFSTKLSFQNFPFNELYKEEDKSYRQPNQFISLWKYTIYIAVIKMIRHNQNIDLLIRNRLDEIFNDDIEIGIKHTTTKLMSGEIRAKILEVVDFGISGAKETEHDNLSWADRIIILENFISKNMDHNKYYILFDELDEDYLASADEDYFNLLTGLFKSIIQIRNIFGDSIVPIAFLRSDIYHLIQNPDKHKWEEKLIKLNWSSSKIQKMLTYRISVAAKLEDIDFKKALEIVFSKTFIQEQGKKRKKDIFDYIQKRTLDRPRDYIYILKHAAIRAKHDNRKFVSDADLNFAIIELSRHIKQTLIDEIYPMCEYITDIFKVFSKQGKSIFTYKEFKKIYNSHMEIQNKEDIKSPEQVLSLLYKFTIIGNQVDDQYVIFYKDEDDSDLKFDSRIVINTAITKALKLIS